MTPPDAALIVDDVDALHRTVVPTVEDKAVSLEQGGGPQVIVVGPQAGTGGGAGAALNAGGRLSNVFKFFGGLEKLFFGNRFVDDQKGLDPVHFLEKFVHVHHQVFDNAESRQRFDFEGLAPELMGGGLAGQYIPAVDLHGTGAADGAAAGAAVGQGAVDTPVYLIQHVQDGVVFLDFQIKNLPVGF